MKFQSLFLLGGILLAGCCQTACVKDSGTKYAADAVMLSLVNPGMIACLVIMLLLLAVNLIPIR